MKYLNCCVCNNEVIWDNILEIFGDVLLQADTYGVSSLTEQKQVVFEGKVCSEDCFDKLD